MRIILSLIFAAFFVFSGFVMFEHGYLGIWREGLRNGATQQVLLDLVICGLLACVWMLRDARVAKRNAWPFVLITVLAGSFGPLLYLLTAREDAQAG